MMMTRTGSLVLVVVVDANDGNDGGGGAGARGGGGAGAADHYRTAFATHSAVSVPPVNGTRVIFSLSFRISHERSSSKYRWLAAGDPQSAARRRGSSCVFSAITILAYHPDGERY